MRCSRGGMESSNLESLSSCITSAMLPSESLGARTGSTTTALDSPSLILDTQRGLVVAQLCFSGQGVCFVS